MMGWWKKAKPYVHPDPDERFPEPHGGGGNIRPQVYGALIFYFILFTVLLYFRFH